MIEPVCVLKPSNSYWKLKLKIQLLSCSQLEGGFSEHVLQ